MRTYNKYSNNIPPKSAGIPTGTLTFGGYQKFTLEIKHIIDKAFDEIIELIKTNNYHTIYFSSELNGQLGTSIFQVNSKVINYITKRIYNLSINPVKIIKLLPNNKFNEDINFDSDSDSE